MRDLDMTMATVMTVCVIIVIFIIVIDVIIVILIMIVIVIIIKRAATVEEASAPNVFTQIAHFPHPLTAAIHAIIAFSLLSALIVFHLFIEWSNHKFPCLAAYCCTISICYDVMLKSAEKVQKCKIAKKEIVWECKRMKRKAIQCKRM